MDNFQQDNAQPQIRSTPYASPMYNFGGSILLLTNPENQLHKMELKLRSIATDKSGVIIKLGEPLLNDVGINSIIALTESIINQDTVMSNLKDTEIKDIFDFLADTLAKDLMVNRITYGIKDFSSRDKIFFIVISSSFICMKRANEEGERRFWKGSQQDITTRVEGMQGKKSLFSRVTGWGGK